MKFTQTLATLFILFISKTAIARVTDFSEPHWGILSAAGTYFHPFPNDNAFDPIPGLTPDTGTLSGTEETYLLPIRLGLFKDAPLGSFCVYAVCMMNLQSSWTVTGTPEGSGTTKFGSWGVGAEVGLPLYKDSSLRFNFIFNGEYIRQKARLTFLPTAGGTDILNGSATSYLIGAGFAPELWLGDQYSLMVSVGYQYGFSQYWKVDAEKSFMGNVFTAGDLLNPSSGGTHLAQFGGVYVSAALKLNF